MEEIKGTIIRLTYYNEESGYFVAKIEGKRNELTVTGYSPSINVGEYLYAQGEWTQSNWGPSFKSKTVHMSQPTLASGIEAYLAHSVEGIGPVNAKRLINKFGDKVFEIIENSPEKLKEVDGIGKKKAESIVEAFNSKKALRDITVYLHSLGLSSAKATKVMEKLGAGAKEKLQENPYLLCNIWGIGFKTADEVALKQGIPHSSPYRIKAGLYECLKKAQSDGSCGLPVDQLIEKTSEMLKLGFDCINSTLDEELVNKNLIEVKLGDVTCCFTPDIYAAERSIAKFLLEHLKHPPIQDIPDIDKKIAEEEKLIGIELDPTQREAVKVALTNQVCVITGGPGAGKTTITKVILNILSKHLNHFKGGRKTPAAAIISLAAPTGKASKRATESTGFPGSTVHRLLEVGPNGQFKKNAYTPLESEVCSFDEFSMMDVFLTKSTFSAIDRKTRLIIIGDHNQLSSVGPGKVLGDIIDSGVIPTVRLTKIFRQALTSKIITNAYLINEGKMPDTSNQAGSDFFFLNFGWSAEKEEMSKDQIKFIQESNLAERLRMQKELIKLIKGLEKRGFDPIRDIQVLAPTRVGLLGTEKINALLQDALNPNPKKELVKNQTRWRTGDKVMQIRNNYDYNVFNGEVGYIQEITEKEIVVEYDDKTIVYKHSDLDELVLAYAYTIHKSQGSEYPVLIMLFDMSHFMMLKRNVLYTGVTRAKKKCYILGPEQAMRIAINTFQPENRYTCLKKWLQEGIPPEYNPKDYDIALD